MAFLDTEVQHSTIMVTAIDGLHLHEIVQSPFQNILTSYHLQVSGRVPQIHYMQSEEMFAFLCSDFTAGLSVGGAQCVQHM